MEKKIREKKIQEYLKQLINNKIDRQQSKKRQRSAKEIQTRQKKIRKDMLER